MPRFDLAPYRPAALDDLVRVGRDHDGGYVVSRRAVDAARVLVGLGINDDWSFEAAFARARPGVRVVGVDGSVSPGVFRARGRPRLARAMARFFDGRPHTFDPRYFEPSDGPTSVSWATLARQHDLLGDGGAARGAPPDRPCDVFLKMDIEGAEYRTLAGVLPSAGRVAGAVVEFHALDQEWDRFARLMDALQGPFAVAHVHGNNFQPLVAGTRTPQVLEVSFVNRRLVRGPAVPSAAAYPVAGLDMPCSPDAPEYALAV